MYKSRTLRATSGSIYNNIQHFPSILLVSCLYSSNGSYKCIVAALQKLQTLRNLAIANVSLASGRGKMTSRCKKKTKCKNMALSSTYQCYKIFTSRQCQAKNHPKQHRSFCEEMTPYKSRSRDPT